MPVPRELVGAFRRVGLIVDGRRLVDYGDVIWLQTPEWFVDMRLLISRPPDSETAARPSWSYQEKAFAGVSSWEAPRITWLRKIDSHGRTTPDTSPLSWEDGVIVERGEAEVQGKLVPFAEEWLRMTHDGVKCSTKQDANSVRIEVGRFAVEVSDYRASHGRFKAVRFERHEDEWVEYRALEI